MNLSSTFRDVHGSVCIDHMFKRHLIQNIITTTLLTFVIIFLTRRLLVVVNFVFLILCFVSIYPQTLKCGCMKLTTSRTMLENTSLWAGDFSFADFLRFPSACLCSCCSKLHHQSIHCSCRSSQFPYLREAPVA